MPVSDILDYIFSGVKITISAIELKAILYLISGGWVDVIRSISFFLDSLLVKFIGVFFQYFTQIVNGTIFSEDVISGVMNRLYVFIGIFVFFKLSMLLIKYISSPELVSDSKVGVNSLVKRVIFGFSLMLFVPFIFKTAMSLQDAIIEDQIIEKVILPQEDYLLAVATKDKVGNLIGMNILQGFWSPQNSSNVNSKEVRKYNEAVEQADPSVVGWASINSGRVLGVGEYSYNYFPILSTIALGYTLYIAIKFCIDVALRSFKLGFLQMMAPIAIVDYITYGSEEGSFKNWLKLCKGTYLMLFVRVLSLWFVVFVTTLMQKKGEGSLLYIPKDGQIDYLLRAIIIMALLAFMMELPKLLSEIFGLDLEGDATVKGLMKSVSGGIKAVAGAGLAMGGAAIGGAIGSAKGAAMGIAHKDHKEVLGALGANSGGILKAGLSQTKLGGTLVNSASGAYGNSIRSGNEAHSKTKQDQIRAQEEAQHIEERRQDMEGRRQDRLRDIAKSQIANNPSANKQEIIDSLINTQVSTKLNGLDVGTLVADINGRLTLNSNTPNSVVQQVQQVVSNKLDVQPETTQQIVNRVLGDSPSASSEQITQIVEQVINTGKDNTANEITQVVNQVMGNVVSNTVPDAERKVNDSKGTQLENPDSTTRTIDEVKGDDIDDSPLSKDLPHGGRLDTSNDDNIESL